MQLFSTLDLVALACFIGAWIIYAITVERGSYGRRSLNAQMNRYRYMWMEQMLGARYAHGRYTNYRRAAEWQCILRLNVAHRRRRHADAAALDRPVLEVIGALPFGVRTTAMQWEAKTMGLAIIFVYAFFKFAWSYRLFNYVAIMVGATPPLEQKDTADAKAHVARVGRLSEVAGQHFNRGQRAFFFALGYLGWFVSPWVLLAATVAVVIVMWRRQFASDSRHAVVD